MAIKKKTRNYPKYILQLILNCIILNNIYPNKGQYRLCKTETSLSICKFCLTIMGCTIGNSITSSFAVLQYTTEDTAIPITGMRQIKQSAEQEMRCS